MSRDRITLFIPLTYYHAEFLRQAVASVFGQTRTDWRLLIVVNQADEVQFREQLAVALADPRVRLIHNQGRLLAGSYNSAMRAAETEFLAVLLGDDLLAPETVEVLGQQITAYPETDFFHSGRCFVDAHTRRISSDYLPTKPVTRDAFIQGSPVKHLMCWRVSRGLASGGVDESLNNFGSDDYDFPWNMLEHGAVFTAIPQPLYVIRDHRDGYRLTTHVPRSVQARELRRILLKHGVAARAVHQRLRRDRRGYLRQSLFRNVIDRWIKQRIGFDASSGWRQPYR